MKRSQTRASRLPPPHEADHGSVHQRLAARTRPLVVPKLILLCCSIHAIVRSTTHLLGSTTKPLGGNSFCQSTATPSLAHSFAHLINTSSGAGFLWDARGARRSSPTSSQCPILALVLPARYPASKHR